MQQCMILWLPRFSRRGYQSRSSTSQVWLHKRIAVSSPSSWLTSLVVCIHEKHSWCRCRAWNKKSQYLICHLVMWTNYEWARRLLNCNLRPLLSNIWHKQFRTKLKASIQGEQPSLVCVWSLTAIPKTHVQTWTAELLAATALQLP